MLCGVAAAAPPPPQKKTPAPVAKKATVPGPARPSPAKPAAAKPALATPPAGPAAPKTAAASPPATSRYSRSWKPAKPPVRAAVPLAPAQPTPERISEIQQALAAKGYYSGSPNGIWGPESIEALKRFQKDHNLRDDGKLSSLSLISLGLGPTRPAADPKPNPDPEK